MVAERLARKTLDKCTSMNGILTAASASRSATLVWVNAAGLMMMKSRAVFARLLDASDQLALEVALEARQLHAGPARATLVEPAVDRLQRIAP